MKLAEKIEFEQHASLALGGTWNGFEISKIEVRVNEFPDHTETSIFVYWNDKVIAEVHDMPMIITYTPGEG